MMNVDRILLVEDDAAIMDTLSMFLRYEGYDVLKARNVEQAIELIEGIRPDLVLLDYMLHDDTAEPVVEALRARYDGDVVVLLLTAADDPLAKADAVHADAVVTKPFELDLLLGQIRECLDARSSLSRSDRRRASSHPTTAALAPQGMKVGIPSGIPIDVL